MTRVATAAAAFAVCLVAAAGALVVVGGPDQLRTIAGSTPSTTAPVSSESATTSPGPTSSPTITRGPFSASDAESALPKEGDVFGPADLEVELSTVCEGATFDLVGATPVYASLQSRDDPLQYLDAVIVVYGTVPVASTAYDRMAEAIGQCPLARTATPTPTAPEDTPIPIEVEGEVRSGLVVVARPAVQWVQIQSADGTQVRTVTTVVYVDNTLVAVSMDGDSESIEADELAADSLAQAEIVVTALLAAAA